MIEIDLKSAWRKNDPRFEADAIDYWDQQGLLGAEKREGRAKELPS